MTTLTTTPPSATPSPDPTGAPPRQPRIAASGRRAGSASERSKNRFVFFSVLPAVVLFVVFMVVPTVNVFRMSLFTWSGFSPDMTFVGFDNFVTLFGDMQFVRAFQNTVLLLVVVTLVTMGGGLILAAVMSREALRGKAFFRFVFYIPNILSIVVIAALFSAIYDQEDGLINGTLQVLSLDWLQQVWLGDQQLVIFSVGIAMVWQSLGYYMVMYISSMAAVPESLYEASSLDGAGPIRQLFQLTIPLIWQNIRTTLTFFVMSAVNLSFVLVTAMTSGGPDGSSEVLLSYMYKQAYTNSSYGYGMAIGVVIFAFSFIVSLIISRATKREPLQF